MTRSSVPDPVRIVLRSEDDLLFWTRRFNIDEDRLRDLVRRFGFVPHDIEKAATREPPSRR